MYLIHKNLIIKIMLFSLFSLIILLFLFAFFSCKTDTAEEVENLTLDIEDDENVIIMKDYSLDPETLTVSEGTTVTWINKDDVERDIKSGTSTNSTGLFYSGMLKQNEIFSFTFTEKGTYYYFSKVHKAMTGKIIVE